jgi:hypothetical protein
MRARIEQLLKLFINMPTASISELLELDKTLLDFQSQLQIARGVGKSISFSTTRSGFFGSPLASITGSHERAGLIFSPAALMADRGERAPFLSPRFRAGDSTPFKTPAKRGAAAAAAAARFTRTPARHLADSRAILFSPASVYSGPGISSFSSGAAPAGAPVTAAAAAAVASGEPAERTLPLQTFVIAVGYLATERLGLQKNRERVTELLKQLEPADRTDLYVRTWKPHTGKEGGDNRFGENHIADDLTLLIRYAKERMEELSKAV